MTAFLGGNPLSYEGVRATNPAQVIPALRNPLTSDTGYIIGTIWINTSNGESWILTQLSGGTATWTVSSHSGAGAVFTITGDSGGAEVPTSGGNFNLKGTTNQITVTGSSNTETWSIPSAFTAPGSITSTTTLTATSGNITASNGNLVMSTAGNKLVIPATSSATCSAGTFTLAGAATTVVSNSAVTANSLIFLQTAALGTVSAASTFAITAKSAGVSFTVTPSQSTDTSVVNYLIVN